MSKTKTPAAVRLAELPGRPAKTRLRKLVCADQCGYPPVRVSRRAIELGLPMCPCGAVLWPWDLEDLHYALQAGSLSVQDHASHPLVVEYGKQRDRIERGQQGHKKRGSDALDSSDAMAALRVTLDVQEDAALARRSGARDARAERLNAADPAAAASRREAAADPIPF